MYIWSKDDWSSGYARARKLWSGFILFISSVVEMEKKKVFFPLVSFCWKLMGNFWGTHYAFCFAFKFRGLYPIFSLMFLLISLLFLICMYHSYFHSYFVLPIFFFFILFINPLYTLFILPSRSMLYLSILFCSILFCLLSCIKTCICNLHDWLCLFISHVACWCDCFNGLWRF